ncbi:hypothetical protein [Paenibacillus baekrokdamisoli]|uniref:hypothetical protein n=1 Tax=Paenibacillus baekrokdamisoli TaxID=1712516 RepID=UPI000F7801BC|nr:hypothetical protein [Paenibacillus baekrokdamisoli]
MKSIISSNPTPNLEWVVGSNAVSAKNTSQLQHIIQMTDSMTVILVYLDADGKGWHDVHVKDDGTILKNRVLVKQGRNHRNPIRTSQSKKGFHRKIINACMEH